LDGDFELEGSDEAGCLYIYINIPTLYDKSKIEDITPTGTVTIEKEEVGNLSDFIKKSETILNIYKDLEVCQKRLNDEYKGIVIEIASFQPEIHKGNILCYLEVCIGWGGYFEPRANTLGH